MYTPTTINITTANAPNGSVVQFYLPSPVDGVYTASMTDQAGQLIIPPEDTTLVASIQGVLSFGGNSYNILLTPPLLPAPGSAISGSSQTWTFSAKPGVLRRIRALQMDGVTQIKSSGAFIETTSLTLTDLPTNSDEFMIEFAEDIGGNVTTALFQYFGSGAALGTIAQLRSYLVGWGKDCTIYDNVLDVNTTNYDAVSGLRAALEDSTNAVVRLNPNLDGQTITIPSNNVPTLWGAGVTLDGTHANVLLQLAAGGFQRYTFQWKNSNNAIFGVHLDGNLVADQLITMDQGQDYFIGHCTLKNVNDEIVHGGGGGRFADSGRRISVMDVDFVGGNTIGKGCNYDIDGADAHQNGRNHGFSVGRSRFRGTVTGALKSRTPQSSGGRHCHWYNLLIEGQTNDAMMVCKHGASASTLAADGLEGAGALAQANYFKEVLGSNNKAEIAFDIDAHPNHSGAPYTIYSYIWYDSAHPSYYDAAYSLSSPYRYDFQAAEPPARFGAPTKADVSPVAGYYETPYAASLVISKVPAECGHLGSTLVRYN